MRSRSYAPKKAVRSCCDTVHLPAGHDDQAYIFTKSMPAGRIIKLCRINILPQIFLKIKSTIDFLYYDPIPHDNSLYYRRTATNQTQETNNALGLSDGSSQGEAIEFTQFEGRKFYRQLPDGFSIFKELVTTKRPFVLPCPLYPIVIWVTIWVSRILSKFISTF